ncbi:MAG: DUF3093 domain-containing protein [bacterium]|nr:DUF3093 domain-containing protein [bacterium]
MRFHERVLPPLPLFALYCALAGSFGLILVPLSAGVATVVAATLAALAGLFLYATSPVIEVEDGWLRAGGAQIEGRFLGELEVLDREEMRDAMGPGADLRAYTAYRDHTARGIRVRLVDPRDPAPYWLLSSRNPEELAEAVGAIRVGS